MQNTTSAQEEREYVLQDESSLVTRTGRTTGIIFREAGIKNRSLVFRVCLILSHDELPAPGSYRVIDTRVYNEEEHGPLEEVTLEIYDDWCRQSDKEFLKYRYLIN